MISHTKLKVRIKRKTNPEIDQILRLALKNKNWESIAKVLSGPTRQHSSVNLSLIDKQTTPGDTVIIPGKVLSQGEITKKVRICSIGISAGAKEKLKKTKSEYVSIMEEIKKNPKAQGLKIIR